MASLKIWRWLRGGIWVMAWQRWEKVHPDNYHLVSELTIFKVEDHRYFKR